MVIRTGITRQNIDDGTVKHYEDYVNSSKRPVFKVVIPTFDRPEQLCLTTLTLLRSHGVPMCNIGVFITPTTLDTADAPEWSRYLDALRKYDMLEVHLLPGAVGLEAQMERAMQWVGDGYFITMSDTVKDILVRRCRKKTRKPFFAPMTKGMLLALFHHGYDLLLAGEFTAWSVNPMHNVGRMSEDATISRKLGLLDGNMTGLLLPEDWRRCRVTKGHGLIYDVEWSVALWSRGHRFVRYMSLCADHTYRRVGGQASHFKNAANRKKVENSALKQITSKFPQLMLLKPSSYVSVKTMQYRFRSLGKEPLMMAKRSCPASGRPLEHLVGRALTGAERMKKHRAGRRIHLNNLVKNTKTTKKTLIKL
jgi:hypothetical protein